MARDDDRYGRQDEDWRGRSMSDDEERWRRSREFRDRDDDERERPWREGESSRYGQGGSSYRGGQSGQEYGSPYGGRSQYGGSQFGDYGSERRDTWRGREGGGEWARGREGSSSQGGQGLGGGWESRREWSGPRSGMGGYEGTQRGDRGYRGGSEMGLGGGGDMGALEYPTAWPGAYEPWRASQSQGQGARVGQGFQGQGYPREWESQRGDWERNRRDRSLEGWQSGGFGSGGMGFGAGTERGIGTGYGGTARGTGSFYGRGPRGYRRSDERIKDDIHDRLTFDPEVDAELIVVEVLEGEVTLRGEVDDRDQKRRAEDLVESVPGVRDVSNHIKVKRHGDRDRDRERDLERQRERERERWTAAGTTGSSMTGSTTGTGGLGAGTSIQAQVRQGMEVVDAEGNRLGEVKDLRGGDFLLDRPMRRDLFVPFSAVRECSGNRVTLRFRDDEIHDQKWESPALMGGNQGER